MPASKRKLDASSSRFDQRDDLSHDATPTRRTAEPAPPSSRELDNTTTKLKATPDTVRASHPIQVNRCRSVGSGRRVGRPALRPRPRDWHRKFVPEVLGDGIRRSFELRHGVAELLVHRRRHKPVFFLAKPQKADRGARAGSFAARSLQEGKEV